MRCDKDTIDPNFCQCFCEDAWRVIPSGLPRTYITSRFSVVSFTVVTFRFMHIVLFDALIQPVWRSFSFSCRFSGGSLLKRFPEYYNKAMLQ